MATYRPKSLNEINSSYGKTITSRNVIKVNETAMASAGEQLLASADKTLTEDSELAAPAPTVGDLTEDIQKFIREFSAPKKAQEKPIPRTTHIKPTPIKISAPRPAEKASKPVVKAEKKQEAPVERPEIIINAEKSELFEEYMKIMSDDDDDTFFSKSRSKKRKKSRKHDNIPKLQTPVKEEPVAPTVPVAEELAAPTAPVTEDPVAPIAPSVEEIFAMAAPVTDEPVTDNTVTEPFITEAPFTDEPAEEEPFITEDTDTDEPTVLQEQPEEDIIPVAEENEEAHDQFIDISSNYDSPRDFTAPEYASDFDDHEPADLSSFFAGEDELEYEDEPVKEKKGKVFLQLVLIAGLLLTLVAALATTLVNVIFKVNTGDTFADKYYIYTVNKDDAILNLAKGDLVVAVNEAAAKNEIIAYYNSDLRTFDFAVKYDEVGDNVTLAESGTSNGQINIFNTNIRGRLIKIYPSVGSIVGILTDNFVIILAVLMALAILLIVILAFAFGRNKRRKDEDIYYDKEASEADF